LIENLEKSAMTGMFTTAKGKRVKGELTLSGPNSSLYMWDENYFETVWNEKIWGYGSSIKGTLNDLKKVSLLNCMQSSHGSNSRIAEEEIIHHASFFFDYAVFGDEHISHDEEIITQVSFVIEEESVLFRDFEAFGVIHESSSIVRQLLRSKSDGDDNDIKVGELATVLYYTGNSEIFSADTVFGKISAFRTTASSFGSKGASIESEVVINLEFPVPVVFNDSVERTFRVLEFIGLLSGRPQNLTRLEIWKESGQEMPTVLQVYGSRFPKYERSENEQLLHLPDFLISPVRNPAEFSRVMTGWLARDGAWRSARSRFHGCFAKQRLYDIDRLVAAANMFDILPPEAVPLDSNKNTLKKKIRHRADFISTEIGHSLPELSKIVDSAVNCRNYYVHGKYGDRIDYEKEIGARIFLTSTLEFIFAVSDLIESGWNVKAWSETGSFCSHPFYWYLVDYEGCLGEFKSVLGN